MIGGRFPGMRIAAAVFVTGGFLLGAVTLAVAAALVGVGAR